jgi:hypothetical protein
MNHNLVSKSFRVKEVNELAVTSNKLINNFAGGLGSDMARGPPVGPR